MRVPVSIAIILCLVAIGVTWFMGTRGRDFITPPAGVVVPEVALVPEPTPVMKHQTATDKEEPPVALDTFADQAAMGSAHLIQLARSLEDAKWPHLAWLAWERVIDATSATPEEIKQALAAIRRLREIPSQSDRVEYPKAPLTIVLHAGTARKHADDIRPLLEQTAKHIESAASGILHVRAEVAGGADPASATSHTPVAIWITGTDSGSRSSEVLSFTIRPGIQLENRIQSSISQLLRSLIARSLAKPPEPTVGMSFTDEMSGCVTRRAWLSIGTFLNLPVEENP